MRGLAGAYVAAIKSIGEVVEGIFHRMAPYCKFYDKTADLGECFYSGREKSHVCAREICPLLQGKEKKKRPLPHWGDDL